MSNVQSLCKMPYLALQVVKTTVLLMEMYVMLDISWGTNNVL